MNGVVEAIVYDFLGPLVPKYNELQAELGVSSLIRQEGWGAMVTVSTIAPALPFLATGMVTVGIQFIQSLFCTLRLRIGLLAVEYLR